MANRIDLPGEHVVPPGPYRRLLSALHRLYQAAGRPGLRTLSAEIRVENTLPATLSHEAIRQILRGVGGVPRFLTLKSLVWVLARHAGVSPDAEVERFLHLWEAVGTTPAVPATIGPGARIQSLPYTPEAVHSRLVSIVADALDAISAETVPRGIRAFAQYAPDKHATLSTAVFLAWLRDHSDFRAAVVAWCRARMPDALDTSGSDPVAAATAALLLDEEAADYYLAMTTRQQSVPRSRPSRTLDPADLDTLLRPSSAHLIVAGDEMYPALSIEDKMDRVIHGLAALGTQTGAEVTVVLEAPGERSVPVAVPRGVRLLFCHPHQRVIDLIEGLIRHEHPHRQIILVTADTNAIDPDREPVITYFSPDTLAARLERI